MGFIDNFFNKQTPQEIVTTPSGNVPDTIVNLAMEASLPFITAQKNSEWVDYKTDEGEQYPIYLEKLYNTSPTHQAILTTKSLLVAGDGFEVDETLLTEKSKLELNRWLNFFNGKDDITEFLKLIGIDQQLYGAYALEVIWSLDFSQIVKVNRISPKHLRSGKFIDGEIREYFYKRDWNDRKEEAVCIHTFDITDNEHHRQLIYVPNQLISNDYYGEPSYLASTNWIQLEGQTGLFYKSFIENGFNPSMIVQFYRKPASLEERRQVQDDLKRNFSGVKNTGKVLTIFSDGKELAPEIKPIDVSNLDKQFIALADQIQSKIITGHRVTTTELFGISTPGKLGNGDFATEVEVFQTFVIKPSQSQIEKTINKVLKINGLDVNFKIKPYEVKQQGSQNNPPQIIN